MFVELRRGQQLQKGLEPLGLTIDSEFEAKFTKYSVYGKGLN